MDKKRKAQVRVLITENLDVVSRNRVATSDHKILMYIQNEDGIERLIQGSRVVPYVGEQPIESSVKFKNGPDGWVEFRDSEGEKQKISGNIFAYLSIPFEPGEKPPKVKVFVSDLEDDE
jgi:hypothetical protein